MVYKTQTTLPLESVKAGLEAKAKEYGFGILGSYDFKQILKSKGFEIQQNITVYEICNPPAAAEALNSTSDISVYLPCRLSVYEENGVTILATIGVEDMLNALDVNEEFARHMLVIFNKIRALMNDWGK
jgi:uncharacterized protein (DUF302 family)